MIYPMIPFPVTLSDPLPRFQGHGVIFMPIDALSVFCAQLTRDLLAIAKFLSGRIEEYCFSFLFLVSLFLTYSFTYFL